MENHFAEIAESQPELLAHHLTAAGEMQRGVEQWLKAGRRAAERSAHVEALAHCGRALKFLGSLLEGPARDQLEDRGATDTGTVIICCSWFQSPDAARAYARAKKLCDKIGDIAAVD